MKTHLSLKLKFTLLILLTLATLSEANAVVFPWYKNMDPGLIRISTPSNLVIRSQSEWQTFYTNTTSHVFPSPVVPTVDFNKYLVVIVASGAKATGGYSTAITGVSESPGAVNVNALSISPVGCTVSQSFTYPLAMILIRKSKKALQFQVGDVFYKCN